MTKQWPSRSTRGACPRRDPFAELHAHNCENRLFRTEQRKTRARPMVAANEGAVVAPSQQEENTMSRNETNAADFRELTDAEIAGVSGGELSDAVLFFIAALASPAPYNPKEPDYSGYGHMIG